MGDLLHLSGTQGAVDTHREGVRVLDTDEEGLDGLTGQGAAAVVHNRGAEHHRPKYILCGCGAGGSKRGGRFAKRALRLRGRASLARSPLLSPIQYKPNLYLASIVDLYRRLIISSLTLFMSRTTQLLVALAVSVLSAVVCRELGLFFDDRMDLV